MLRKFISMVLVLGSMSFSFASDLKSLDKVSQLYTQIDDDGMLIDYGLYVNFSKEAVEIDKLINDEGFCKNSKSFRKISARKLVSLIESDLSEAIERAKAYKENATIVTLEAQTSEALQQLAIELLKVEELKICKVQNVPAYSDGHTLSIVKINNKHAFLFELGFPD
jgi:hypothetical protein